MTAALEISGVSSGYGEALVLRNIDLVIEPGEIFALLGKNGMGKSTLLKTIMGYLPARAGHIRIAGAETTGLPLGTVKTRIRTGMATLRQDGWAKALLGHTSIEEILRVVA